MGAIELLVTSDAIRPAINLDPRTPTMKFVDFVFDWREEALWMSAAMRPGEQS
jgi:hypothetical protein